MMALLERLPQGWRLTGPLAALLLAMAAAILGPQPEVDDIRLLIRATARTSLLLFGLAFTAAALWRLWPGAATQWLRRNRRYLGVSFAVSHAIHLAAIIAFARLDPAAFTAATSPLAKYFGGGAYVMIALMTLTSFDRTAAMIGRRAWSLLHTVGAHWIWLIFAISYLKRTPISPAYWIGVLIVFGMMGLRIAAKRRAPVKVAA